MESTWSAGQNAGPMARADSAPRPTDGARGVKRRAGGRGVTDCGAAADGALDRGRRGLPLAPRGAPLMTLLVLSDDGGRPQPGWCE